MASSPKLTRVQEEAQRYVDEHQLDRMVTQMMNKMIKEKPDDPKLFMITWLTERCNDKQLNAIGLQKASRSLSPSR
eukprot:CAMPEP_0169111076 /NCGR_PEP_ID=MMETSP1015-20121227/26869_1 /TAXON_ID=342587 /ORGANISM="Karlodinium micrum, Strain CCMP2283" /LENGTH=75 /DNA_ID=CAMNT_0009172943 /DNA_START=42 /DNA_END=269 /DNA_ORIENTATION=+